MISQSVECAIQLSKCRIWGQTHTPLAVDLLLCQSNGVQYEARSGTLSNISDIENSLILGALKLVSLARLEFSLLVFMSTRG